MRTRSLPLSVGTVAVTGAAAGPAPGRGARLARLAALARLGPVVLLRRVSRPVRGGVLLGLGFFLVIAAWSLATPIGSTDEPAHIVKAVATARLEFHGRLVPVSREQSGFPAQWDVPAAMSDYRVPLGYRQPLVPCFYDQTQSPACAAPLPSSWKTVWAPTYVGSFNPTYYAIVGWPSLLLTGDDGVYAMRLCSAAVSALMLGLAGFCLLRSGRGRAGILALGLAATPMALFAGAIINPSGMEISAAILAWCAALGLLTAREPNRRDVSVLIGPLTLGLVLLSEVRLLGPLWVAVIVVTALLVSTKQARSMLRRDRRVWAAGALVLLAIGTALWWSLTAPLELFSLQDSFHTFLPAMRMTADTIPIYLQQMVFLYGWAEAAAPTLAMILVFAGLTALVLPTLSVRRYGPVVLLLLVGMVVLPMLVQGYEMHTLGVQWQGRYQLPYAAGIPLVAAYAVKLPKQSARWTSAAVAIIQAGCLWWTIRRNGDLGGLWGSLSHWQTVWSPPSGGWFPPIALATTGIALLAACGILNLVPDPDPGPATAEPVVVPAQGAETTTAEPALNPTGPITAERPERRTDAGLSSDQVG